MRDRAQDHAVDLRYSGHDLLRQRAAPVAQRRQPDVVDLELEAQTKSPVDLVKDGKSGLADLWSDAVAGQHENLHSCIITHRYTCIQICRMIWGCMNGS